MHDSIDMRHQNISFPIDHENPLGICILTFCNIYQSTNLFNIEMMFSSSKVHGSLKIKWQGIYKTNLFTAWHQQTSTSRWMPWCVHTFTGYITQFKQFEYNSRRVRILKIMFPRKAVTLCYAVLLVMLLVMVCGVFNIRVNLNYQGLTSVPWDQVDPDCTELYLQHNALTSITIPLGLRIKRLYISNNNLQVFDFSNVKDTLEYISVQTNQLTGITIPSGAVLTLLDLSTNQIEEWPDFSNTKDTLQTLRLSRNRLTNVAIPVGSQ